MSEAERGSRSTEGFFGRRHGKTVRPRQAIALASGLDRYRLDLSAPMPKDPGALFAAPVTRLSLEIGFGGGEHLLHRIDTQPSTGFIGVEPFVNGMAKMMAVIAAQPRDNLRVHDDDATQVLDWLTPGCLDAVDLLYPDPWPKPRHWKRRFVNLANLDRIARVLKSGGVFRFASDIETYVDWTLDHCRKHPAFEGASERAGGNDRHQPYEGWPGTRYEAKALREGRKPVYLAFSRQ